MEDKDYPVEHFRRMVRLAEDLRTVPAQIMEHAYHHEAFGSWVTTVGRRGRLFRIVFDGKEREVRLERATTTGDTRRWGEVGSSAATGPSDAQAIAEMVDRLKEV
ncbi:MAG TPA: hypothetical protein VKF62_10520 [Planctomycetota bacterium]|nr:hypothetical protein [Planctomycetota bacterium]